MTAERRSASAHVGPGASDVRAFVAQAGNILDALDYGTSDVMFDGYMLVRKVLTEAIDSIDNAVLARLKDEARL